MQNEEQIYWLKIDEDNYGDNINRRKVFWLLL